MNNIHSVSSSSKDAKPPMLPFSKKNAYNISIYQVPDPSDVTEYLGPYQLLHSIGQGGMGNVFLAYDTLCGRYIALKRIRSNLTKHAIIKERFLRESRLTSQL